MLGRTADSLLWMARYLERIDHTASLLDAGFRLEITGADESNVWHSVLVTAGLDEVFDELGVEPLRGAVLEFMLRDPENPSSIVSMIANVRANANTARTTVPRSLMEALNECCQEIVVLLASPVSERELPQVVRRLHRTTAQVQGVLQRTMLRGDAFRFYRLGTFIERADNTARILDVKYYVLLPAAEAVGSLVDRMQWELILRSVSALKSYTHEQSKDITASGIVEFIVLSRDLPRSLRYCAREISEHLHVLGQRRGPRPSQEVARALVAELDEATVESIISQGLHDFLEQFVDSVHGIGQQIEADYRFSE